MLKMPSISTETCVNRPSHWLLHALMYPWRISNCLGAFHNAVTKTPDILHWGCVHKAFQMASYRKIKWIYIGAAWRSRNCPISSYLAARECTIENYTNIVTGRTQDVDTITRCSVRGVVVHLKSCWAKRYMSLSPECESQNCNSKFYWNGKENKCIKMY